MRVVLRLTDGVLRAIEQRLASVPPERGGALMAAGGLVHLLVEDTQGCYSGASWDISAGLSNAVGVLEREGHGVLFGTVHTHPAGIPDPSGTDVKTTTEALALNPHLKELLIAVVTAGEPRDDDLSIGKHHRMSLHILRDGQRPALVRVRGRVVPLAADMSVAGIGFRSATTVDSCFREKGCEAPPETLPGVLYVNQRPRLTITIPDAEQGVLLVDPDYPTIGPLVFAAPSNGPRPQLTPLASPWDPVSAPGPQLAALVRAATGRRLADSGDRVWPLVGRLAERRVLVAGLGSVGSRMTEDLVRCGVGHFTIVDPDRVEGPNLSRTVYSAADLGALKADALERRLRAIDPAVAVEKHPTSIGKTDLPALLTDADLVVAATDDMNEQALLAHHAYAANVPLVACALYRAAAAGEVVLAVPEAATACWLCAVGPKTSSGSYRPDSNYDLGGRLAGEVALGPSIHLVAGIASSLAVGLLAGPDTPAGRPIKQLLAERRTLGLVTTTPHWEFFPKVFQGMDHQYAPQSVWVRVEPTPSCPVCGVSREPPASPEEGFALAGVISDLRDEECTTHEDERTTEVPAG